MVICHMTPPQTLLLLYKYRFKGVIFTRRNFPDELEMNPESVKGTLHKLVHDADLVIHFTDKWRLN